MRSRTVLLGLVAWVAVVAVGSGITWLVIDAAGQQVLGDRPAMMVAPTPVPFPSLPPSVGPSTTIEASPRPVPQPSPSSTPTGTVGPATPAPDASVVRTWRGAIGTVVVRCRGYAVSLDSATPSDGYRAAVGSRGPRGVAVAFADGGVALVVHAYCLSGRPWFAVE